MTANYFKCLAAGLLMAGVWPVAAQNMWTAGTRGGVSFESGQNRFQQVEAFSDLNLPWQWNVYSDWRFQPRIDASGGSWKENTLTRSSGPSARWWNCARGNFHWPWRAVPVRPS